MNLDQPVDNFSQEEKEILSAMGFEQTGDATWHHEILDKEFDLSANSLEGVISKVYKEGGCASSVEAALEGLRSEANHVLEKADEAKEKAFNGSPLWVEMQKQFGKYVKLTARAKGIEEAVEAVESVVQN